MNELDSLKVVAFDWDRVANEYPGGDLPWQMYHTVRNSIVEVCRKYGPTGPMGVVKIVSDVQDPYVMAFEELDFWERGDPNPSYFILDDQLNHERYCYAELYGKDPFNAGWLLSIATVLQEFEGWGLGVTNIPDSYLLIFGERLMVKGQLGDCKSAGEVVSKGRRLLSGKRWWQFWR